MNTGQQHKTGSDRCLQEKGNWGFVIFWVEQYTILWVGQENSSPVEKGTALLGVPLSESVKLFQSQK